jgi:hypothetical protein
MSKLGGSRVLANRWLRPCGAAHKESLTRPVTVLTGEEPRTYPARGRARARASAISLRAASSPSKPTVEDDLPGSRRITVGAGGWGGLEHPG